ncbi:family 1 glycosylhydrolase [Sphingomonas sp.]|uniref:glycoside hydrolase family 1 protein n=1 Tax=Sphingomonas sp. TaxID=28214 RepID=UPI0025FC4FBD|nr:family 1 glycosylhydrolase [Sphingomonas sp.]
MPAYAKTRAATPRGAQFLWGAATAAHQVEGNNVNADIWLLEQVTPTVFAEPSGDADDSLHRWREDVGIVRGLGLTCYRFSVEWSRIEPAKGQFSQAYLDYYSRIVDYCRELGLAPVVTFNHFTTPRWFAASGGWIQKDAPALFARFADKVARAMAGSISHAVTFNEPNLALGGVWPTETRDNSEFEAKVAAMTAAAARASGSDRFDVLNAGDPRPMIPGLIEAHRQARAAIKAVRGDLPLGLSLALSDDVGIGPDNALGRKRKIVYEPFFELARDDDFIGVQTYGRAFIGKTGPVEGPKDTPRRANGGEWYPSAIGNTIRYAHEATGKPVLITENGIDAADDTERARFIPEAIASVEKARIDGVPVIGYIHWSLLDNFEWLSGYGPKYGLVAVDRKTFARTIKPSARLLGRIARNGGTRGIAGE